MRQITASLSFTRACPCPPPHTQILTGSDNMISVPLGEKTCCKNVFSKWKFVYRYVDYFFSLHYERKEKCYSLDGVLTSHDKPQLQTCLSLTEDCWKKVCGTPLLPPRYVWLWFVPHKLTLPSKFFHTGTEWVLGTLESWRRAQGSRAC